MRRLIASEWMTLAGVVQAPISPGKDGTAASGTADREGGDLLVIGSARLAGTLLAHDLLDELRLIVDPVLVGGGTRIFHDDGVLLRPRLIDYQATATGAIIATCAPAAE